MKEFRERLVELGFFETPIGNSNWPDYVYSWETDEYRYGSRRIWITSKSNWNFEIERAFQGYETGVEGYSRYTAFKGVTSSWDEFETILKCTGVLNDIQSTTNIYKNKVNEKIRR